MPTRHLGAGGFFCEIPASFQFVAGVESSHGWKLSERKGGGRMGMGVQRKKRWISPAVAICET